MEFFFSSRRRHTRFDCDWSSDVCSSDLAQATALDAERKAKGPRGPLHGIPILVKDNVATRDRMQSTAGSLALVGVSPPPDAVLVGRLRAAGAALLREANLFQRANFRSAHS